MRIEDLTDQERKKFEEWIIAHVDAYRDVPADEGNTEALVYNLIHHLREGDTFTPYAYTREQDAEITTWFPEHEHMEHA
jgi:hypothetical protein